jgi:porin
VSKQIALAAGKINAFDFVDMLLHTGRGIDGFMNTSLILPIGLGETLPLGLPVAGVAKFKGKEVQGFAAIYDNNDCSTTTCLDHFFEDPSVLALWKFYTGNGPEGARAGYIAIGGSWTSKQEKVVSPQSFAFIPGVGLALTDTQQSWSVFSVVNHELWVDPSSTDRFLNFRGMYTITDGEANPIKWSVTAALEMNGPIPRRDKDVLGVGYFHTELSNGFKDTVGPLLSLAATVVNRRRTRINIEDTDGFEAYYKAQITPWFAVTGDVQVITETLSNQDTKVVAGIRGKIDL